MSFSSFPLQRGPPTTAGGRARPCRPPASARGCFNGVPPRQQGEGGTGSGATGTRLALLQRGPPTTAGGRQAARRLKPGTLLRLQRGPPTTAGGRCGHRRSPALSVRFNGVPPRQQGEGALGHPAAPGGHRFNGVPPRHQGEGRHHVLVEDDRVPAASTGSPHDSRGKATEVRDPHAKATELQRGPPTTAGGRDAGPVVVDASCVVASTGSPHDSRGKVLLVPISAAVQYQLQRGPPTTAGGRPAPGG